MRHDNIECVFNDSDEDCSKCAKHGIIFTCAGCKDFKPWFGNAEDDNDDD